MVGSMYADPVPFSGGAVRSQIPRYQRLPLHQPSKSRARRLHQMPYARPNPSKLTSQLIYNPNNLIQNRYGTL